MAELSGKRVVVIGGTSGIGFAVAELACAQGAEAVLGSSSQAHIGAAVERLPGARGHRLDLRDEKSVAAFFGEVGAFDHLAITAGDWGRAWIGSASTLDLGAARDALEVRFWGALAAVKHACRTIAKDGSITLTSGARAHRPTKGVPVAVALGGAVEFLARGLAVDLAPVRVNAVCPGIVLTEYVRAQMPEERVAAAVASLPVPRAATPAEAARAYVYLMLNGYVTAQVLHVDGGAVVA